MSDFFERKVRNSSSGTLQAKILQMTDVFCSLGLYRMRMHWQVEISSPRCWHLTIVILFL